MKVLRIVPNISSDQFAASRDFYIELFDLTVSVALDDWYLQLMAPDDPSLNLGFLPPAHELFAGRPSKPGDYALVLTIEVDDIEQAYSHARRLRAEIPLELRDNDNGQHHFLVVDPNGLVLNVMSAT